MPTLAGVTAVGVSPLLALQQLDAIHQFGVATAAFNQHMAERQEAQDRFLQTLTNT